ncbi:hypothetical protein [Poseidonibacter ostreae]|uniref:Uncharacterized protein n=1 Tax=Poseidonibacter ostreae TaxID=2654171 RepID=A0A6L4WWR5_9BACT|nr:hypothetical protein [Poseidonibacter ostreae]KAB7891299.1 hypothetical protein GBG19_00250 [Poseidonibacter ostreae]
MQFIEDYTNIQDLKDFLKENIDEVEDFISLSATTKSNNKLLVSSTVVNNSKDTIYTEKAICRYENRDFYFYEVNKVA